MQIGFLCERRETKTLLVIHAVIFSLIVVIGYPYYLQALQGLADKDGNVFGRDFSLYWTAITLLKQSDIAGLYSLERYAQTLQDLFGAKALFSFLYPPHFLLLLWPFTWVHSYKAAYALWTVINAGAFGFALFWRSGLDKTWRWIAFCAPMVLLNMFVGQNGLLTAAFIVGGFRLLGPMPVAAGIVFGIVSIKPQLALLMPLVLLALGRYRALVSAAVTVVCLMAVSAMVFGVQSWILFAGQMIALQADLLAHPIVKMVSIYSNAVLLGWNPLYCMILQSLVAVVVAAVLFLRLRRMRSTHWTDWLMLTVPALYLVTPYGFVYDLCALNAAWVLWLAYRPSEQLRARDTAIWLALWYAPFANQLWYVTRLPVIPVLLLLAFAMQWRVAKQN